ncbi:MAG: Rpn family recombination-promoting nuclease/putative transposase [Victivallales bacterium]|nr:Rpn family recombination-promoting nuclease/putative transposase [Victivallales bacterium]
MLPPLELDLHRENAKMREKDSLSKEFLSDPFVFADAFNGAVFGGEQVIAPDALSEMDTTVFFHSMVETGGDKLQEKRRDVLKMLSCKTAGTTDYVILAIEEQSSVDYAMPLRTQTYDVAGYNRQAMEIHAFNRREKKEEVARHFVSQLLPQDKLNPIVTLVLFLSDAEWDGPRSLREMMKPFPKELEPFINDYKLNLLCPSELNPEDIHRFRSDLAAVLMAAKYARDNERLANAIKTDSVFRDITNSTTEPLIRKISNYDYISNTEDTAMGLNLAEKTERMSQFFYHRGEVEGIEKGRQEGERNGAIMGALEVMLSMKLPEDVIFQKMRELYSLSKEQVLSYMSDKKLS